MKSQVWIVEIADGLGRTIARAIYETEAQALKTQAEWEKSQQRQVHAWRMC